VDQAESREPSATVEPGVPPIVSTQAPSPTPATAAALTMKLIDDQLTEERATKTSLESRANGVIASAGTLTTLLFALAAVITQAKDYQLPGLAKASLVLAAVAFLISIIYALRAASPGTYQEVETQSLYDLTTAEALYAPVTEAEPRIANATVQVIDGARQGNAAKAKDLKFAVQAELAAAILLAAAVTTILLA
jgi:hypothetical protein